MPGEAHSADVGEQVRDLLRSYGRTYAQEAGIRLADQPSALYQLLVLTTLGRGHYKRYDESTARMLGDGAGQVIGQYQGGLRRLRDQANGDADGIAGLLEEFPGIGPVGASIYLREVQDAWPSVAPYVDDRMTEGARHAGLPDGRDDLAAPLTESGHPSRLAAALVRLSRIRNPSRGNTAKTARES